MEMTKNIYLETLKSALGRYILHYSSRVKTSKKKSEAQIGAEIMFSIPMLSSVHSDLLAFCGVFIIWVFKLTAITLWKSDIPVIGTNIFFGFSIVNDIPVIGTNIFLVYLSNFQGWNNL